MPDQARGQPVQVEDHVKRVVHQATPLRGPA